MRDAADVPAPQGAYGFRLPQLDGSPYLQAVPADWPALELAQQTGAASGEPEFVDEDRARIHFRDGGEVLLDRALARAALNVPRLLTNEELIHPYLAPIAAVGARWVGRESFHAGAIAVEGGVWALLGDRGAGKSSVLAWLALNGGGVFCDDVLVVGRDSAFAGPRAVDLRAEPARQLGAGDPLGKIGTRRRWRLRVEPVELTLPLRGWIVLRWTNEASLREIGLAQRVPLVIGARALRVPPEDPAWMLDLAALPAWEVGRTRGWASLEESAMLVLQAAGVNADVLSRSQSD